MPVPLQEQWPYTKHHTTICVCVFCFINIGFRIYALQYPMHLWLWIDVRFDGLAVVFCCGHEHWHWMWFMLSRGGCARGASLSIDKIMMLPIFLFNLFLYIISVALQCVSLTLSVDQPLSSLLENLCFFLLRAHLLAVLFVWQFLSRNWCANDITHCICYTYIYIGRCHVRVRLVFFIFSPGYAAIEFEQRAQTTSSAWIFLRILWLFHVVDHLFGVRFVSARSRCVCVGRESPALSIIM